jgi:hypothetical protein
MRNTSSGEGTRLLPRERWRIPQAVNTSYPHACTREQFDRIQAVLQERRCRRLKTTGEEGFCRDVVWFPEYPGIVSLSSFWIGHNKDRANLIYQRRAQGVCSRPGARLCYIERNKVHEAALDCLKSLYSDPIRLQQIVNDYNRRRAREVRAETQIDQLTAQLQTLRHQYEEAVNAEFDAQEPLRSVLKQRRLAKETAIRTMEQERRQLERHDELREQEAERVQMLIRHADQFEQRWEEWTEPRRREFVNASIDRVHCRYEPAPARGYSGRREVEKVELQLWFRHDDR